MKIPRKYWLMRIWNLILMSGGIFSDDVERYIGSDCKQMKCKKEGEYVFKGV